MRTSKLCNVVMLPTEIKATEGDIILTPTHSQKLIVFEHQRCTEFNQHLYITSNEEIKEGDWFLWQDEGHDFPLIMQCNGFTNNTHIKVNSNNYWGYRDWNKDFIRGKIIASTDKSLIWSNGNKGGLVPWIPKSFILAFIKAYNEGKPITEVQVEYEVMDSGGINSELEPIRIKTRPDNSIIIHQSKLYTRDEVIGLIKDALSEVDTSNLEIGNSVEFPTIDDKWIEENL